MNYIFCGHFFSDVENDLKKMESPPPVSSHKYQLNLLKGLVENKQSVWIANIPRVRYFPHYPQILFKRKTITEKTGAKGVDIGFINLPILNYVTQFINLKKELKRYIENDVDYTLISFNNYYPQIHAMIQVRNRFKRVYVCNVLGDIHGAYGVTIAERHSGIKGKIVKYLENKRDNLSKESDAFGFLAEPMATALEVTGKPYTVIEGMVSDGACAYDSKGESENKVVFYAGALEKEYGLPHLIRAFSLIKDPTYRLVIAGSGGMEEEVKNSGKKDSRIEFLGFISPSQVEEQQSQATCLVNPRTSEYEYVKYSFPSKNMECLKSGKPFIAHDLPCNPPEYKNYMQCPKDESDESLSVEIVRVCSLTKEERQEIGRKAQEFIIREKNPRKQSMKIIEMMDKLSNR